MAVPSPAEEIANAYLDLYEQSGLESSEAIRRLCALATPDDALEARLATRALFRLIVERLGDGFEPHLCDLYVRFFSQVADYCRRLPRGRWFDEKLNAFGLRTQQDFLRRAERVRQGRTFPSASTAAVRKVLVLSRVTLGADIAVTSVVLSRMKQLFASAELLLLGGSKAGSLFASDPRIRLVAVEYPREGTLLQRLSAWASLAERIALQTERLAPGEYLIVDPDSRFTQLGLLPVAPDESSYYFFESRSFCSPGGEALAELTGRWLDGVFGAEGGESYPYVSLARKDCELGTALRSAVRGRLASVSFGVGDNPAKRVPDPFELELILALLDAGYTVLLDRGVGEEELDRTARLTSALRLAGKKIESITEAGCRGGDVMTWEGTLSGFASLIAVSDLYVGYDSAGGHLAAALGVPVIDVFAGASSPRMIQRWHPWGRSRASVVVVPGNADPGTILAQVREHIP